MRNPYFSIQHNSLQHLLLSILLSLCACTKDPDSADPTPPTTDNAIHVTGIIVSPDSISLILPNASIQLVTTVIPATATNDKVAFSSGDLKIATVDNNGLVTAVSEGVVVITAKSLDNSSVTANCKVKVLKPYDMYIVGYGPLGSWGRQAILWKNEIPTILSPGFNGGRNASFVTVQDGNVHILGTIASTDGHVTDAYWKNGIPLLLSTPTGPLTDTLYQPTGLVVDGNDILTSGYKFFSSPMNVGGYNTVAYYKRVNGSTVETYQLGSFSHTSLARGIALLNNDVYIAGHRTISSTAATFWKNSINNATVLDSIPGMDCSVAAVLSNGNDIYFTVIENSGNPGNTPGIGSIKLFKNNSSNPLTIATGNGVAFVSKTRMFGDDIYICGSLGDLSRPGVAKVWKISAGVVTTISLSDGQYRAVAEDIAFYGDVIFVVGAENDNKNTAQPKYWKISRDTVSSHLLPHDQFPFDGSASGIFIK